ncbi:MAG: hypothetical protein CM1200mP18_15890 [Gammaproteobacteria bacterium]|nr:MAG: hypothetical protein CM1200mP18_15890 [Gammaproteobacteria bacterium]
MANEDLLTSFDGACVCAPGTQPIMEDSKNLVPVDQNPAVYPEFDCIQGLVNLFHDSGFRGESAFPGSHNHFPYSGGILTSRNLPKDEHYFEFPQKILSLTSEISNPSD